MFIGKEHVRECHTCTSKDTRSEGGGGMTRGLSGCNYRYPGSSFRTVLPFPDTMWSSPQSAPRQHKHMDRCTKRSNARIRSGILHTLHESAIRLYNIYIIYSPFPERTEIDSAKSPLID